MDQDLKTSQIFMFSHGIAFFVRNGIIKHDEKDDTSFSVKIKSKNLNDVLKSLLVTAEGGTITEMSYTGDYQSDKNLISIPTNNTLSRIIERFQGYNIQLETYSGEIFTGRLSGIESTEDEHKKIDKSVLIFNNDTFHQIPFADIESYTFTDEKLIQDLEKSLEVASYQRDQIKELKFHYVPELNKNELKITIGYSTEIPLWKVTYRVVISDETASDDTINLQSWTIIANPSKEDWNDIDLALISGRPVSFMYDLNRPDFLQRTDVTPSQIYAVSPIEAPIALPPVTSSPMKPSSDPSSGLIGGLSSVDELRSTGINKLRESLMQELALEGAKAEEEKTIMGIPLDKLFDSATKQSFSALELGEAFVFNLKHKITIKAEDKALIPLISTQLPAKKLLYLNALSRDKELHPYNSLEIRNNSDFPLENGPAMIFEGEIPAGEALFPACFKGQIRLLSYSQEARVKVHIRDNKPITVSDFSFKPEFQNFYLVKLYYQYQAVEIEIYSSLDDEKELILDYQHSHGWELTDEIEPNVTKTKLENGYRFRAVVSANKTMKIRLKYKNKISEHIQFSGIINQQLFEQYGLTEIPQDIHEKFVKQFQLVKRLADLQLQIKELTSNRSEKEQEQERIRKNLQVIKAETTELKLRTKFIERLTTNEDALDEILEKLQTLNKERDLLEKEQSDLFRT